MGGNYPETLQDVSAGIKTLDRTVQSQSLRDCVKKLRRILSGPSPPVDEVIQAGIVSYLVDCLKCQDSLVLFEATWSITNLVAGTDTAPTNMIVDKEGIPALVALLQCGNKEVRNQAMWALSNIAANTVAQRDSILESGALPPIVTLIQSALQEPCQLDLLQLGVWTLSNLCTSKPYPNFAFICPVFSCFADVLESSSDLDVVESVCWALSDLTSTHLGRTTLIATSCLPRLVEQLDMPSPIYRYAFKIFGNLVSGDDDQTAAVLATDFLRVADRHLNHSPEHNLLKEICFTLSNLSITSITEIWNYNFIKNLFRYLDLKSLRIDIKREILYALFNTIEKCNTIQIQTIVYTYNAIHLFSRILNRETDALLVDLTLSSINFILKHNLEYAELMEREGGFDVLQNIIGKVGVHSAKAFRIQNRHFQTVMARRSLRDILDAYQNELLPTVITDLIVSFTYPSMVQ